MIQDEGGPKPIREEAESDPAGATGDAAKEEVEVSSGQAADESGDESADGVQGAIDVDLAHDRAS